MDPFSKSSNVSFTKTVEVSIINNITKEVGKLSVIITDCPFCPGGETCDIANSIIQLCEPICYDLPRGNNYGSNAIDSEINNRKINVYFNLATSPNTDYLTPRCNSALYTLGVYSKEDFIVEDLIINLKNYYQDDYEGLRSELGIFNDFKFSFREIGGTEVDSLTPSPKLIPKGIDVESKDTPVRVIDNNGEIKEYIINIRLW